MAAGEGGWGQLPAGPSGVTDLTSLITGVVEPWAHMVAAVFDQSSDTVYAAFTEAIIAIDRNGAPRLVSGTNNFGWSDLVVYGPGQLFGLNDESLFAIDTSGEVRRFSRRYSVESGRDDIDSVPALALPFIPIFKEALGLAITHARPTRLAVWQYNKRIVEVRLAAADALTQPGTVRNVHVGDSFLPGNTRVDNVIAHYEIYAAGAYSLDDKYLFALRGRAVVAIQMDSGRIWRIWDDWRPGYEPRMRAAEGLMVDRDGALIVFAQLTRRIDVGGSRSTPEELLGLEPYQKRIGAGPGNRALVAALGVEANRFIQFRPVGLATTEQIALTAQLVRPYKSRNAKALVGILLTALTTTHARMGMFLHMRQALVAAMYAAQFAEEATAALIQNVPFPA